MSDDWINVDDRLPPPHQDVWCYNRDGYQFQGRICYGMHKPFFTYPRGDGSSSDTTPDWIDVTHWQPLMEGPHGKGQITTHPPKLFSVEIGYDGDRIWHFEVTDRANTGYGFGTRESLNDAIAGIADHVRRIIEKL